MANETQSGTQKCVKRLISQLLHEIIEGAREVRGWMSHTSGGSSGPI